MKKLIFLFAVLISFSSFSQERITAFPKATNVADTDQVVITKMDSTISKTVLAKYLKQYMTNVKDTTPSTGNTVTATTGYSVLVIHGSGTLAALTVKLPVSPLNSQQFTICTDQTITTLTISGGTTVQSFTTVTAIAPIRLIYDTANTKWYSR